MNKSSRHRFSSGVVAVLGERELVRLIEDNGYPARLIEAGVVWVELEITDTKTNAVRRERLSKSAFADLILDWRGPGTPHPPELSPAPRKKSIAAQTSNPKPTSFGRRRCAPGA